MTVVEAPVSAPLRLGTLEVAPAVVLAPMAGVTDPPFRTLCAGYGGGLYVSEMVTARALVERNAETLRMVAPAAGVAPRSVQLYGTDPRYVGDAVRLLVEDDLVDHVDLNFGCPVPKVTRRGGGAALPWKRALFRAVVRAAVGGAAGAVPVTVKMRMGLDDAHLTYLDAGRTAEDAGVAAVALHARTAEQHYSGAARWEAIAALKDALGIPVLGNGDVWEATDALRMMRETGCDGVVVGRGCLGRPWLFRALDRVLAGAPDEPAPPLGEVAAVLRRHATLTTDWYGEDKGCRELRKHVAWYLKGYPVGGDLRRRLGMVSTTAELDDLLGHLDPAARFLDEQRGTPRGRQGSPRRPALPAGWLDDRDEACALPEDEAAVSGG